MSDTGDHHRGLVVVVGASLAGVRAAETLRSEGHRGPLTIVGAERHWPPIDRPPLSKQVLDGKWDLEKARLRVDTDALADVDLRLGTRAVALDTAAKTIALDDGTAVAYDGLVIATGVTPRTLPALDGREGVFTLRTADDSLALSAAVTRDPRPSVAVIGAGFIGSEVASTCVTLGCEVTVIEALPLPLVRALGEEMGRLAADIQRDAGVNLVLDADPSAATRVDAEVIVVGVGVRPATDWLADSGLVLDDGVVCDESCGAVGGGNDVVAAGDVARWPNALFGDSTMRIEHWTNATEQAEHAARTLVHGPEATGAFAPVPYFWSDQFGHKLQFVGTSGPDDEVRVVEGSAAERKLVAAYIRDGTVVGALCLNWPKRTIEWRERIAVRDTWTLS